MGLSPLIPNRNELGDPLERVNELGASLPPLPDSAPQLSQGLQPLIGGNAAREADLNKQLSPKSPGTGFWDRVRHVAATIGNVAGDALIPNTMARIPGTQLGDERLHDQRSQELAGLQSQDRQDVAATGDNALKGAETTNQLSEANARDNPKPPDDAWSIDNTYQGPNGEPVEINKTTGQARIAPSVHGITRIAAKPEQPKTTDIMGPDGKAHTMGYDEKTGKFDVDEGVSGFKPNVTNNNAADNHLFAEQERGRGLLDAAEKQYRTAQQGANTMRDMLAQAEAGNKMSGQMLPLEGALAITTAQGVHRINRTEVDQFAGGGSLYDTIAGKLGKLTAGQPMDAELRADVKKLTDMQEAAAYSNYKDAHASATRRYKLEGEEPLPPPSGGSAAAQTFTDGGKQYNIPVEHVAEFKRDHPNAR